MRGRRACRPSYMRVCAALPLSNLCSTSAAASFFLCSGSSTATALVGVAVLLRTAQTDAVRVKDLGLRVCP